MKTETELAKENIKLYRENQDKPNQTLMFGEVREICKTHKQTCQRFLEFLGELGLSIVVQELINPNKIDKVTFKFIKGKIQDLKTAIKIYEKEGI